MNYRIYWRIKECQPNYHFKTIFKEQLTFSDPNWFKARVEALKELERIINIDYREALNLRPPSQSAPIQPGDNILDLDLWARHSKSSTEIPLYGIDDSKDLLLERLEQEAAIFFENGMGGGYLTSVENSQTGLTHQILQGSELLFQLIGAPLKIN